MTIYIVAASLTNAGTRAEQLLAVAHLEMNTYTTVSTVTSDSAALDCPVTEKDGVILANPYDGEELSESILLLVERAQKAGAVVAPVAMSEKQRTPPAPITFIQSYDVPDKLRVRSLPDDYLHVVAKDLARNVLSRVQPTLSSEHLRIFLCHRRADGEELARKLDTVLSSRHNNVFRDLVSVGSGTIAQEEIEKALEQADSLVFLDTPSAGESQWVERELQVALGRGIPIVWVRLDAANTKRATLRTQPAGRPHLQYDDTDTVGGQWNAIADQIVNKAHELAGISVASALQTLGRIRSYAKRAGLQMEVLDSRQSIFALGFSDEAAGRYPRRTRRDIVQVFGHHPTEMDQENLIEWLQRNDYGPHAQTCRAFDAAVLLDPLPRVLVRAPEQAVVIDHGPAFLESLTGVAAGDARSGRRMLLLGAFPEGSDSQEPLKRAVHQIAGEWLRRGGHLVFGGHPTFTPLILDLGKRILMADARERITVYQSRWWITESMAEALKELATIRLVDAKCTPLSSLSAMRQRLVNDEPRADLVVAIGGRTEEKGTHSPGIDDEIGMVESLGLPVYLVGAGGGRSAELAAQRDLRDHGRLTVEQTRIVCESDDFVEIASILWDFG